MLFSVRLGAFHWKINKQLVRFIRSYSSQAGEYIYYKEEDEYSKTPKYPDVEPIDKQYLENKSTQSWYDKIKRLKTVEEKLFEINVQRFWGWKCLLLKEGEIYYDNLDFIKFVTRTHLIETNELPSNYNETSVECARIANQIKAFIKDSLIENHFQIRHKYKSQDLDEVSQDKEFTKIVINELHRVILRNIATKRQELLSSQTDYSPRFESFWYFGSLPNTYVPEVYKNGLPPEEIPEEYIGRPSDKFIQYIGNPILQLRLKNPLPPVINQNEALYFQYPVPVYKYDPFNVFEYEMVRRHVTSIPGFWPGESRAFSCLSYLDYNHVKYRPTTYGLDDVKETIQCQAILSSFAWLMSISTYHGFSSYHDVTYPFVTQTILTDGRQFSFAVYQLNTTELHYEDPLYNPKCNICWITPKMDLYEIKHGKIEGINENVVKFLLQFYMNRTEDESKIVRKPYLDEKLVFVANYEDEEKRAWLESRFKHVSSNRPKHRVDKMYEVADFERIFKIENNTMIRDPRKRPFELRENPYLRKISDGTPEYIPKRLREDAHLPKWKQRKFKKTFYPE